MVTWLSHSRSHLVTISWLPCIPSYSSSPPEQWVYLYLTSPRSPFSIYLVSVLKVWDDLSMWNYDFANVSAHTDGLASFTLPRINELELNLLKCLKFKVKVAASEYAKYYFLIRNMLLRNRLVKEDAKPLGRKLTSDKLEILNGTSDECLIIESRDQRPKSMDLSILEVFRTEENNHSDPVFSDSVCLEQLMQKNQKI